MGSCKPPGTTCLTKGSHGPDLGTLNRQCSSAPNWTTAAHHLAMEIDTALVRLGRWFHFHSRGGSKLDLYVQGVAATMPAKVQVALPKIQPGPRYVLALRGYLRRRNAIDTRWAWTDAQAADFKATPEY